MVSTCGLPMSTPVGAFLKASAKGGSTSQRGNGGRQLRRPRGRPVSDPHGNHGASEIDCGPRHCRQRLARCDHRGGGCPSGVTRVRPGWSSASLPRAGTVFASAGLVHLDQRRRLPVRGPTPAEAVAVYAGDGAALAMCQPLPARRGPSPGVAQAGLLSGPAVCRRGASSGPDVTKTSNRGPASRPMWHRRSAEAGVVGCLPMPRVIEPKGNLRAREDPCRRDDTIEQTA